MKYKNCIFLLEKMQYHENHGNEQTYFIVRRTTSRSWVVNSLAATEIDFHNDALSSVSD